MHSCARARTPTTSEVQCCSFFYFFVSLRRTRSVLTFMSFLSSTALAFVLTMTEDAVEYKPIEIVRLPPLTVVCSSRTNN